MRQNALIPSFNRGLISRKALGRVDLDRVRLSAEVYTNWLPATQGSMSIRPGTKWKGSSLRDTGAAWLEFVASTDDVALVELTKNKMRLWLGEDAHDLALLARPKVDTTVSLSDTGWSNASTGGLFTTVQSGTDLIPTMTAATTNGVTITASSQNVTQTGFDPGFGPYEGAAWKISDDDFATNWADTGVGNNSLPSWLNVDFGAGLGKNVGSYSLRAASAAAQLANMAKDWRLLGSNYDTGTYATDTGKWVLEDTQGSQTGWASNEKRTYSLTDTGTPGPWRHWRLFVTAVDGDTELVISELEMFQSTNAAPSQASFASGQLTLNATSIGALAKAKKRVMVSDTGTEHSLAIYVQRGPVTLRVGSTDGDDDYVSETSIGTGYHNLAFTPQGNFWVTLQSDAVLNRIVGSLAIGDSGTVEITTPWDAGDLANIRYDQSADVVYVDCADVRPQKIERRGTGRSWSVVDYFPRNGPFLPTASSSAKMMPSARFGNTRIRSDVPFFTPDHTGGLIRLFHQGQSGRWRLGAEGAATDPIEMTGISDTGTASAESERRIVFSVSGTWAGRMTIERSIDGKDVGFKTMPSTFGVTASDTGTFTKTIDDPDDNLKVWYRARIADTGPGVGYTSGVAEVTATYGGGGVTGIARITNYVDNQEVDVEVVKRFSDTGPTDNWQQGYWSGARTWPTSPALHGGRLAHAGGGSLFLSVSDDYENFDDTTIGDAGPIVRTLGSGPVDAIRYLVSLLRLVIGTAGGELTARSSSLDEPLTPSNSSAVTFSTQGSANLRAVKMDTRALFVQRSGQKLFVVGFGAQGAAGIGDYEAAELTLLVPDLLEAGIVALAIQRQPDTRIHCVLADGRVAILTYEPAEEVLCWSVWATDTGTGGAVEKAMVLPGTSEDAVYYHVRRTINGVTKRYLEKWAKETETKGDTGLHFLADCAGSYTDTGRATFLHAIVPHLGGEQTVIWASLDTGSTPHVDLSPDVAGVQTKWTADTGGDITLTGLTQGVHHAVAGLPYQADWKSAKLAYGAQAGTALAQVKRVPQSGLILLDFHNNGLFLGSDSGHLDPLPRVFEGAVVDADAVIERADMTAIPIPSTHDPDARLHLRAKSPRPVTVLATVPSVGTTEKV